MGAVLNVSLRCLLRMLTPFFDFQELVFTRAPSSANFSSAKGGGFYFCLALNKLLEACALFCMLFLYGAPLTWEVFFLQNFPNFGFFFPPPHVEYFSEVLYMNTPYSAEYTLHSVCTCCMSHDTWPSADLTFQLSVALYWQTLSRIFFRSEKR